jgi:hypothetical protein
VLDLEAREPLNTVTLKSMSRMADAMGCKLVYGIVPKNGKTLEDLAEARLWASVLGGEGAGTRDEGRGTSGLGNGEQGVCRELGGFPVG